MSRETALGPPSQLDVASDHNSAPHAQQTGRDGRVSAAILGADTPSGGAKAGGLVVLRSRHSRPIPASPASAQEHRPENEPGRSRETSAGSGACRARTGALRLAKLYSAFRRAPMWAGITVESRYFVRGLAGIAGSRRCLPAAACGMCAG